MDESQVPGPEQQRPQTLPPRPDLGGEADRGDGTGPPPPAAHRRRGMWTVVAVIAILGVGGTGLALLLQPHGSGPLSSTPTPAPGGTQGAGTTHSMSVTISYPGSCAGVLQIALLSPKGKQLTHAPIKQVPHAGTCDASGSAAIPATSTYGLVLQISDASGHDLGKVPGPLLTTQALAAHGYSLHLTLAQFGMDPTRFQPKVDLQSAISSAEDYYKAHNDTLAGLTVSKMRALAPSLRFNASATASAGQVSLRLATPTEVLFVEKASDGTPIVMGIRPPKLECYGEIDTRSFKACVAWQPSGPSPGSTPSPSAAPM